MRDVFSELDLFWAATEEEEEEEEEEAVENEAEPLLYPSIFPESMVGATEGSSKDEGEQATKAVAQAAKMGFKK